MDALDAVNEGAHETAPSAPPLGLSAWTAASATDAIPMATDVVLVDGPAAASTSASILSTSAAPGQVAQGVASWAQPATGAPLPLQMHAMAQQQMQMQMQQMQQMQVQQMQSQQQAPPPQPPPPPLPPPPTQSQQPQPQPKEARNALIRKEWTAEEDALIRHGVATGKGWRYIASQLPGRSDDGVRNRWKRLRDPSETPPTPPQPGGNEGGAAGGAPKAPAKPKGERVTWSPAEDAVRHLMTDD